MLNHFILLRKKKYEEGKDESKKEENEEEKKKSNKKKVAENASLRAFLKLLRNLSCIIAVSGGVWIASCNCKTANG